MEKVLFLWFSKARSQNLPATGEILTIKAKPFGDSLGVADFQYLNGWLQHFKMRYGIGNHVISGESAGIDKMSSRMVC